MLSARLKTPPAVQKSGGLIHKMQVRYARFLRWTLEHRGKSLLGIAPNVAASFVPVMHTKTNMFGGDGGDEINVYYPRKEIGREKVGPPVTNTTTVSRLLL